MYNYDVMLVMPELCLKSRKCFSLATFFIIFEGIHRKCFNRYATKKNRERKKKEPYYNLYVCTCNVTSRGISVCCCFLLFGKGHHSEVD